MEATGPGGVAKKPGAVKKAYTVLAAQGAMAGARVGMAGPEGGRTGVVPELKITDAAKRVAIAEKREMKAYNQADGSHDNKTIDSSPAEEKTAGTKTPDRLDTLTINGKDFPLIAQADVKKAPQVGDVIEVDGDLQNIQSIEKVPLTIKAAVLPDGAGDHFVTDDKGVLEGHKLNGRTVLQLKGKDGNPSGIYVSAEEQLKAAFDGTLSQLEGINQIPGAPAEDKAVLLDRLARFGMAKAALRYHETGDRAAFESDLHALKADIDQRAKNAGVAGVSVTFSGQRMTLGQAIGHVMEKITDQRKALEFVQQLIVDTDKQRTEYERIKAKYDGIAAWENAMAQQRARRDQAKQGFVGMVTSAAGIAAQFYGIATTA